MCSLSQKGALWHQKCVFSFFFFFGGGLAFHIATMFCGVLVGLSHGHIGFPQTALKKRGRSDHKVFLFSFWGEQGPKRQLVAFFNFNMSIVDEYVDKAREDSVSAACSVVKNPTAAQLSTMVEGLGGEWVTSSVQRSLATIDNSGVQNYNHKDIPRLVPLIILETKLELIQRLGLVSYQEGSTEQSFDI